MYQNKYFVTKISGTYAETLEAYGLAKILSRIFENNEIDNANIKIKDEGPYYSVSSDISINEEMVNNTHYFDAFPYIKTKEDKNKDLPGNVIDYEREKEIASNFYKWAKGRSKEEIEKYENKPPLDYDIIYNFGMKNNKELYQKIHINMYKNREKFPQILKEILALYSAPITNEEEVRKNLKKIGLILERNKDKVTAIQLLNPHQGKGANSLKSNSIRLNNLSSFWLREYLKIIGTYESMIIKDVKVSNKSWDTKFYVIDPFNIEYSWLSNIYREFKPHVGGNTPFKLDILSILIYTKELIKHLSEYQNKKSHFLQRLKPKNIVQGFKTAYQKKMGQNKSIANIGYLRLPEFIEISSYEEGQKWIDILDEHIGIIRHIDENNSSTTSLLQHYRQFISTGDWDNFFDFYFDYATLLMNDIEKRQMYLKAFTIKNLKEVFMTEKKLAPILESQGFQNVARAIRNATIGAQYAKARGDQRFDVHYGIAQDLKRKSPYKKDLVEYLSEFIALYNAETARYVEHHSKEFKEGKVRATVKTEDIKEVINLIDEYGSSVVGKLLAAYGYALERKEITSENDEEK